MKMKLASIVVAATILLHGPHPASTRCILQVELLPQQQSRQVSFSSPFHSKSNRTFEDLWCLAKAVAARMSLPRCIKRGGWWSPDLARMAEIYASPQPHSGSASCVALIRRK